MVTEIDMERIGKKIESDTETLSYKLEWGPLTFKGCEDLQALYAELDRLTPSNEELLKFAEIHPADGSWLSDNSNNPFTPNEKN